MNTRIERLADQVMASDNPGVTAFHHRAAQHAGAAAPSLYTQRFNRDAEARAMLSAVSVHASVEGLSLSAADRLKVAARIAERAEAAQQLVTLQKRAGEMRSAAGGVS
ncbi:hypothetical protein QQS45_08520 [Alteriqipengyuania flavescens]|uniref:hypothetical protein n=1 Tax=Alteriqipengyuania flavescens TaxID=3053610 RepID=UPI0025B5045F|nr:hypothetical protein [Alteriqipengyuania flavescens]WJY17690.1 hypothetical protein QQW98_08515 [Alteriqipengyuania flavescens]WJY23633.1 hypothetical protein QQS45_08520 [Alteriqipengyuania flavescens]